MFNSHATASPISYNSDQPIGGKRVTEWAHHRLGLITLLHDILFAGNSSWHMPYTSSIQFGMLNLWHFGKKICSLFSIFSGAINYSRFWIICPSFKVSLYFRNFQTFRFFKSRSHHTFPFPRKFSNFISEFFASIQCQIWPLKRMVPHIFPYSAHTAFIRVFPVTDSFITYFIMQMSCLIIKL